MTDTDIYNGDELRDLYRELILDHARNPRHFGKLDDATHTAAGINPLCGDKLKLYLRLDAAKKIDAASFEGSGCAISVASASLLTDAIIGLDTPQAMDYFNAVTSRLTHAERSHELSTSIDIGKMRALDGVREFPARIKCATLARHALIAAINQHPKSASTE